MFETGSCEVKIRSAGKILEKKHCINTRRHSTDSIFINLARMFIFVKSRSYPKVGYVGSKTRTLLGQILEKKS